MYNFRIKYTLILLAWVLALSGIGIYVAKAHFYEYFSEYLIIVPVFFLVVEWLQLYMLNRASHQGSDKMQRVYMLFRLAKMSVSAAIIIIYALAVREVFKTFLLVFALFYIASIVFDVLVFYKLEKQVQ